MGAESLAKLELAANRSGADKKLYKILELVASLSRSESVVLLKKLQ